jgi:hypothetical protein
MDVMQRRHFFCPVRRPRLLIDWSRHVPISKELGVDETGPRRVTARDVRAKYFKSLHCRKKNDRIRYIRENICAAHGSFTGL